MNYASCIGRPQQIPLWQLSFSNEAKPHYHYKALCAISLNKTYHRVQKLYYKLRMTDCKTIIKVVFLPSIIQIAGQYTTDF